MSGATEALEGFANITIEVGQRDFEVTYEGDSIDAAAIKAAVDASGNTCEIAN